jgi:hypothetical protein
MPNPLLRRRAAAIGQRLRLAPTEDLAGNANVGLLRDAAARLREVRIRYEAAVGDAAARAREDTQRAPVMFLDRLEELRTTIAARFRPEVDAIEREVRAASNAIFDAERAAWPQPEEGVESFMARQAMRGDASRLLAGGVDFARQVNEAEDVELVHALVDEIPVALRVNGVDKDTIDTHVAHANRRLFELAGAAEAYDASCEAEALMAELEPTIIATRKHIGSPEPTVNLQTAITAQAAGLRVRDIHRRALELRNPAVPPRERR